MALKAVLEALDDLPEAVREFYKEQDGVYVLDLGDSLQEHPGAKALKNALDAERDKRRKAIEDRDRYKEKAESVPDDFDPDEYERLKVNGEGGEDVQKKVEEARERERKRHEKTIEKLTAERDELSQKYQGTRIETSLKDTLNEVNVAPHLRRAAEKLWASETQLDEDGNVVTKDGTPLKDAIKEWSETDEGSYFVAAPNNSGGGAHGGRAGGASKNNPWAKDNINLTEQMRIQNTDPERANRLKAEAGA